MAGEREMRLELECNSPGGRVMGLARVASGFWSSLSKILSKIWRRALRLRTRANRRLRLCESLPLGEHRFIAVIEFEGARFLLGGTSSALVLLSQLEDVRKDRENLEGAEAAALPGWRTIAVGDGTMASKQEIRKC
jgi:Flagellar biosynthesis protein, FliO